MRKRERERERGEMRRNREALIFKHSTCRFIADSGEDRIKKISSKEKEKREREKMGK